MDCSLVPPPVDRAFKQSRRKLSLIETKQHNSRRFSPSKVSCYMVYGGGPLVLKWSLHNSSEINNFNLDNSYPLFVVIVMCNNNVLFSGRSCHLWFSFRAD